MSYRPQYKNDQQQMVDLPLDAETVKGQAINSSAVANTIPVRDGNGNVKTNTPISDTDAANKAYVDSKKVQIFRYNGFISYESGSDYALDIGNVVTDGRTVQIGDIIINSELVGGYVTRQDDTFIFIKVVFNGNAYSLNGKNASDFTPADYSYSKADSDNKYATKSEVNAKYTKPSSGIPKSDLAQDVQKILEPKIFKAINGSLSDTIGGAYILSDYQISPSPSNIKAGDLVYDNSGRIARFTNNYDGTDINSAITLYVSGDYATKSEVNAKYTKPNGGIPKSDLAQAVQTSLGKADTALQSAPVTSVAGKTGAVTLAKGDVGLSNVDNVQQYSASNPPPYPVSSVNGQTGAVNLTTADAEVLSGLAFDEGFGQTSGNIVGYRIGDLVVISVVFTPGSSGIAWREWALATGLPLPRVEGNLNPNPEYVGMCMPATPCALSADGITDVQFNLRVFEGSSRLWIHRCTKTNGAKVGAGIEFKGTIVYVCQ